MKVLILGCSYTTGSYSFNNNKDEMLSSNDTWLDHLPCEIVHYCGWGMGYIQWVDILEDIENLNEYDAVILAESIEPKFQLTKDAKWAKSTHASEFRQPLIRMELTEDSIVYSKGIKHRNGLQEQLGLVGSNDIDYIHSIGKNDSVLNIVKACVSHINNKLADHNIPGYIIKSHENVDFTNEHSHCTKLDVNPLFTIVDNDKELVNIHPDGGQGHFTTKGNNLLARCVADAWHRRT